MSLNQKVKVISITFPMFRSWPVEESEQLNISLLFGCHLIRWITGRPSAASVRYAVISLEEKVGHQSETSGRHVKSPGGCLDDWDRVQLASLRMLLRSLLLYSLWSTGWTSITVTFTRLSSWGENKNLELSAATTSHKETFLTFNKNLSQNLCKVCHLMVEAGSGGVLNSLSAISWSLAPADVTFCSWVVPISF